MATLQESVASVIAAAEAEGLKVQILEADEFVTGDDHVGTLAARTIKLSKKPE